MLFRRLAPLIALAALVLSPGACGGGGGGEATPRAEPATETPAESRTIVSDDGKLTLEIPPGAVGDQPEITVTSVPLDELPDELQALRGAGTGYRLEPDGLEFSEPVAVRLELDRAELEGEPEDGITAYALVSLSEGAQPELLDGLVTKTTLGEDTVLVRGELTHFSWLARTQGSLTVEMNRLGVQQPVGGTFLVQARGRNSDQTGKVTLLGVAGTYFAIGGVISIKSGEIFSASGPLAPGRSKEGTASYTCDSAGVALYGVSVIALSIVEGQEVGTQLEVKVDREVECVVREPTPTLTPAPEPTEAPGGLIPSGASISLGCDHRIPGVESDVLVKIEFLLPGQTVKGSVTGPGVIGDGIFSAPADEIGVADAAVPIKEYGLYEVTVDDLSDSIDVGPVCEGP